MEEQKNEQQSDKRKNVRWEYMLEPFNKPTYWDHAALSTEERRARGRRTVLVKEPKLEVGATNATVNVGYGLKLTYDLPVGKSVRMLRVRACWHDVVFRNELGFTESMFLY